MHIYYIRWYDLNLGKIFWVYWIENNGDELPKDKNVHLSINLRQCGHEYLGLLHSSAVSQSVYKFK